MPEAIGGKYKVPAESNLLEDPVITPRSQIKFQVMLFYAANMSESDQR